MATLMSETSIIIAFSKLTDPRKPRNRLYKEDIICTAILATLCRCEDYYDPANNISVITEDGKVVTVIYERPS